MIKKDAVKRKKGNNALEADGNSGQEEREQGNPILSAEEGQEAGILPQKEDSDNVGNADRAEDSREPVTHPADKDDSSEWSFMELADMAKRNQCDMLSLLKGRISITEVAV